VKEEAPYRAVWRTRFGRGYGAAVTTHNSLNEWLLHS